MTTKDNLFYNGLVIFILLDLIMLKKTLYSVVMAISLFVAIPVAQAQQLNHAQVIQDINANTKNVSYATFDEALDSMKDKSRLYKIDNHDKFKIFLNKQSLTYQHKSGTAYVMNAFNQDGIVVDKVFMPARNYKSTHYATVVSINKRFYVMNEQNKDLLNKRMNMLIEATVE